MAPTDRQSRPDVWQLASEQHGLVTRMQLRSLGYSDEAIKHRVRKRRLSRVRTGVYAVGRGDLTAYGVVLAAVLACGSEAFLTHESAGWLWGLLRRFPSGRIEVSIPVDQRRRGSGAVVHRRRAIDPRDVTRYRGIPVSSPALTLLDLATRLNADRLEAAINEADKRDLITPERLRRELERFAGRPGAKSLREVLDRATYGLTDSELERIFLRLVRRYRFHAPRTQAAACGLRVDFLWPEYRVVVETDGLRYHRTAAQQAADRHRDQILTAAGYTVLRFTHWQVVRTPAHVAATLGAVLEAAAS